LIEMARTRPIDVPDAAGAEDTQAEPFDVRMFPAVPGLERPVPPLPAGSVPVTPVVNEILVMVLLAPLIVLFVSVAVLVAVSTLVGVMIEDNVVMSYSGCAGQVTSQGNPNCSGTLLNPAR
jgi:hypothetical protein